MKKPNPIVSAEYLDVNPDGSRGAVVKVIGSKEDMLRLWMALTLNLGKTLNIHPRAFAAFLTSLSTKDLCSFTDQCTTIDLSKIANGDC